MTHIFVNNLRRISKSGVRILILVVIPILFMNVFVPKNWEVPLKVAIIDQDNTPFTLLLRQRLGNNFQLVDLNRDDVQLALINKRVDYAVRVQAGFTEQFLQSGDALVEGFGISGLNVSPLVTNNINSFLNAAASIAQSTGEREAFNLSMATFAAEGLGIEHAVLADKNRDRTSVVLGFLVQFMIYASVMTTGLILEERSNRALYRIFSAPISIKEYMAGHLLSSLSIALVQVTTVLLFLRYVMGIYFGAAFINIAVLFAVFALVCTSMGLFITAYCQKPRQAYVAIILLATPLVMLGGCYWPRSMMPDVLIRISNLIPTSWLMEATTKLLQGGTLFSVSGELIVLLAFAAVFFFGGVLRKVDVTA